MDAKKSRGRPRLTKEQQEKRKSELLQRIQPFLQSGLSINRAIIEARIANSELYEYMRNDDAFREKIYRFKQFSSILLSNALVRELFFIVEKQRGNEEKGIKPQTLSKGDKNFLWKFALKYKGAQEEWGRKYDL